MNRRPLALALLALWSPLVLVGAEPAPATASPATAAANPAEAALRERIKNANDARTAAKRKVEAAPELIEPRAKMDAANKARSDLFKSDEGIVKAQAAIDAAHQPWKAKLDELLAADAEAGPVVAELAIAVKAESDAAAAAKAADGGDPVVRDQTRQQVKSAEATRRSIEARLKAVRKVAVPRIEKSGNAEYDALKKTLDEANRARQEAERAPTLVAAKTSADEAEKAYKAVRDPLLAANPEHQAAVAELEKAKAELDALPKP